MNDLFTPIAELPLEQQVIRAKCVHPTGPFVAFQEAEIEQSISERFEQQVEQCRDIHPRHSCRGFSALLVKVQGYRVELNVLLLSAKTLTAMERTTTNVLEHLARHPALNLADVAYTLQVGRKECSHRRMLV